MIPMSFFLIFSAALFCIGLYGIITTEKGLIALMCIELMLNSANINLVTFSSYGQLPPNMTGQAFAVFSIAIAAAEVAVGIAIMLNAYRLKGTNNTLELNTMRW